MLAYTYKKHGVFELTEKDKPQLLNSKDAIVKITMSSICSSDIHIKHGSVPKAVLGTTIGHEMVGVVEEILSLIEQGKIDTTPLITHKYPLKDIEKTYEIFENRLENVIKIAIVNS